MTLRAKALALYEAIRPWLGSHTSEPVQQALEQELSRMLLIWSGERPTCAGWYWYKPPGIDEPRLVNVDNGGSTPSLWPTWVRPIIWWT